MSSSSLGSRPQKRALSRSSLRRASVFAPFAIAIVAACATGNSLDGASGSGGGGGDAVTSGGGRGGAGGATSSSTGAGAGSKVGDPCPCAPGLDCTLVGSNDICTEPCGSQCPAKTYCALISGSPVCVPDDGSECAPCTNDLSCTGAGELCLGAPLGDKFCARDCTTLDDCPPNMECAAIASYPPSTNDGGTGDGGTSDGGAKDGGTSDGGAKDGGADAGTSDGGATAMKVCVPVAGQSCPCNAKRDGVARSCENANSLGTCVGIETCDGAAGKFTGCDAKTAVAETCNGKDDDCDSIIDDGDPNVMCASMGTPLHTSWQCTSGACVLAPCDTGWANYPTTTGPGACTCAVEATEPNDTCANATNAGSVTDVGGSPLVLTGTLSSATDVDVYQLSTIDTDEMTTNSYHVAIYFTAPATNNEFVMDVERGATCVDSSTGGATAITSYDYCVNATDGSMNGELSCGPDDAIHCTDHSSTYFVRVYRKPGATGTCTAYSITVTGGGGTCDLTKSCN